MVAGTGEDARLDEVATGRRRAAIVAERLAEARPWPIAARAETEPDCAAPPDGVVTEYLRIEGGEWRAGEVASRPGDAELQGAGARPRPAADRGQPAHPPPEIYTDHDVRFRQIICPETGRLLDIELPVDGSAPRWDVRVAPRQAS